MNSFVKARNPETRNQNYTSIVVEDMNDKVYVYNVVSFAKLAVLFTDVSMDCQKTERFK